MREFTELQVLSDHACITARVERLEVYEPISMETLWISIFRCCAQIYSEPSARVLAPPTLRALQTRVEAA